MKSVDLILIDPTFDELRHAVADGAAAVNRDQGHGDRLRHSEAEVRALWQSLADQPEGSREWRVRGNGPLYSVEAVLVAVWWSDFLGRHHVRVVGASTRRGAQLPMPLPSPQYPALACLYPATSLLVSQQRRLQLLAVCDCGVWGRPEQLAWMGPCCGPCFDRLPERPAFPARLRSVGAAERLTFSPDGRHLAAMNDASVALWEVSDGTPLARWEGPSAPAHLAFSPEGTLLAWNLPARRSIRLQRIGEETGCIVPRQAFAFWRGAARLVVLDDTPEMVEIDAGTLPPALTGHTFRVPFPIGVHDMAVSGDGQTLAVAADRAGLLFWDTHSGEPRDRAAVGQCTGPTRWSPDGSTVAVGVWAPHWKAVLWDVHGQQRRSIIGTSARLSDLAFTSDGALLVTCEDDGLRVWDAVTGQERRFLAMFDDCALSIAFSPDGRLAAIGTEKGVIRLWPADLLHPE